ncbi:Scr1 family TA system antitoxin-like transcriptional regulator [Streptomyces sp. NPDC096094]|uniref:Scr1 family TA system antitoxin-like transcriptional regulator n=1 Tax=Streptomyces sp. NPDC096094 TaxID=3366073 RepID=UPI00381C6D95
MSQEEIEARVQLRADPKELLERTTEPQSARPVLSETALRQQIREHDVTAGQTARIAQASERSNVATRKPVRADLHHRVV